jgi:membrane protease YdiL (CAAX protease family)
MTDVSTSMTPVARGILIAGLGLFALAPLALVATGHTTIRPSADSTATLSVLGALLPAAVALLLVRLVPPTAPTLAPVPDLAGRRVAREALVAVGLAVAFAVVMFAVRAAGVHRDLVGLLWTMSKPVVLILIPWLVFRRLSAGPVLSGRELWRPAGGWRWWGPVAALVAFGALSLAGPWAQPLPRWSDYPDPTLLVIGATITVLTANVGEELFYRVLLQSRLEAVLGRWPGIVAAALLFALMHLATHGQGGSAWAGLPLTLGAIVTFQGVFGLLTGYLWARYRNVWALIAVHSVVNTLPLLFIR